jgi:hypothetical protein
MSRVILLIGGGSFFWTFGALELLYIFMDEINKKIDTVLEMLISETAWAYQRHKSHTEEKSINSFLSRSYCLDKSKEIIQKRLNG